MCPVALAAWAAVSGSMPIVRNSCGNSSIACDVGKPEAL
jgi:hypothetical protein